MELRRYWGIVWRRFWIVVLLPLVVAVVSIATSFFGDVAYEATMRMIISIPPEPKIGPYFSYEQVYSWQSAEYLIDDFSEVIRSQAFAQDVKTELGDGSFDVASFAGAQRTSKTHRILTLKMTSSDPEQAQRIAQAVARVIETKGKDYFAQLNQAAAQVKIIDPPQVARVGTGFIGYFNLVLRIALGFIAALALVFLLHYLDDTIYEAGEAERWLGVPVLGEIPPER